MNIMFFLKPKSELAYIYDYHTLRQAMEIMEYHKYSCVPILNKEGKYVGSITEGDVLWALKKLDIFNIKEAEDISIMKLKRRVDYQCVTAATGPAAVRHAEPGMGSDRPCDGTEFCTCYRRPGTFYRYYYQTRHYWLLL